MFDKKTDTYFFCKRELVETLLSLADSQNEDIQASLLCSAHALVQFMPAGDFVEVKRKNASKS